jgi:hypothetical protein
LSLSCRTNSSSLPAGPTLTGAGIVRQISACIQEHDTALRRKPHYFNLGEFLRCARRRKYQFETKPKLSLEHGDAGRQEEKLGWLQSFDAELEIWQQRYCMAARTERALRKRGLYNGLRTSCADD